MVSKTSLYENAGGKPRDATHYSVCRICGKVVATSNLRDSKAFNHALDHYNKCEVFIKRRMSSMWTQTRVYNYYIKSDVTLIDGESMRLTKLGIRQGL